MRRLRILARATILGYLPDAFHSSFSETIHGKSGPRAYQRVATFRLLHECIEIFSKPLAEEAYCRYACRAKSGTSTLLHFLLTSCVTDIPETKGSLRTKIAGQTTYCSHECIVMKEKLHLNTHFPKRNVREKQILIKISSQKSLKAIQLEQ